MNISKNKSTFRIKIEDLKTKKVKTHTIFEKDKFEKLNNFIVNGLKAKYELMSSNVRFRVMITDVKKQKNVKINLYKGNFDEIVKDVIQQLEINDSDGLKLPMGYVREEKIIH